MQKHITALLLCLLLCCGAMIPLMSEIMELRQMEATQATEPSRSDIQLDTEVDALPEDSKAHSGSHITIIEPGNIIHIDDNMIIQTAITGYGVATEGKLDWQGGVIYPYTGGEMALELFLQAGKKLTEGVAVMLFLNGKPQPFSLEDSRMAYQHTVYPGPKESNFGISFVPITGTVGEAMELCVMYYPSYDAPAIPEDNRAWYQEKGVKFFMLRLDMQADPPDVDYPETTQRLLEFTLSWEPMMPSHHDYWSFIYNGKYLGGSTTLDTCPMVLDLSINLYSGSGEAYWLTVYVDDEPALQVPYGTFTAQPDHSMRIHALLDCLDLAEGEHTVFALLLRQHYWEFFEGWTDYPDEDQLLVLHILGNG